MVRNVEAGELPRARDDSREEEIEAGGAEDMPATVGDISAPPPLTRRSVFERRDSHPVLLDMLMLEAFGPSWLSWEPETTWSEIKSTFGADASAHTCNKINALKTLHVVDSPWTEWEVFHVVVHALTDNIPDFRLLHRPSPDQIVSSIEMLKRINVKAFSEEVSRYIAACFLDEGIWYLPPPVDFAQSYASMPRYRCRRCGRIDSDDDNDMCDSCGAPQEFLERTPTFDPDPVRKRYEVVLAAGDKRDYFLMEDVIDIQVAKLLRARRRAEEYAIILKEQSKALR